jgi:hypothetical protein
MSTNENSPVAEDLQLEGSDAEAVVGGRASRKAVEKEMARLEAEGYLPDACTSEGTLMVNPHNGKKKMVKLS